MWEYIHPGIPSHFPIYTHIYTHAHIGLKRIDVIVISIRLG
jgi:hypothetical protein